MAVKHKVIECRDSSDETRLNHIKRVLQTIEQQKECSVHSERIKLCEKMVINLGLIVIPSTPEEFLSFVKHIEEIQKILVNAICEWEMITATLQAFYSEISNPTKQPSPTMSIVLQLIPNKHTQRDVKIILQYCYNKGSLQQALSTLCTWLCKWTFTPNLGPLVLELIKGLEADQHYDILINITLNHIEGLFRMVLLKESRWSVGHIVLHMLSSMRHSPDAFHKIIPHVGRVLATLNCDDSEESHELLHKLVSLFYDLLEYFPKYPINDRLKEALTPYIEKVDRKSSFFYKSWSYGNMNMVTADYSAEKVGLNNLGNTCYMNSVLQALYMTKTFRKEILLNGTNGMTIFSKLQSLFALLQFSGRASLSPSEILSIARPPDFQPGHQHDSSEFLGYLLDVLHEQELSLGIDAGNLAASSSSSSPVTVVKRSFGGKSVTVSKCKNCGSSSNRSDTFRDLPLSFPSSSDNLSVQTLLDYYLQPEILCGDNQYHCDSCRGLTDGERETRILEPPPRLVLTLKHFRYDPVTQSRTKILQRVELNDSIAMKGARYNLYAAVVHSGSSVDSGHYYTYAKDDDDWYKFNDCFVTKSDAAKLCGLRPPEAPYILFYSRIDCEDSEPVKESELSQRLLTIVRKDAEEMASERRISKRTILDVYNNRSNSRDNGGDEPPPPGCGGGGGLIDSTQNRFVC